MEKKDSGLIFKVSGNEIRANRPEPMLSDIDVVAYKRQMDPQIAIEALVAGEYVLVLDFYSSGLTILNELKKYIQTNHSARSFKGQRDFRSVYQRLSQRLLLLVTNNQLRVRKAPSIGWLKTLYPGLDEFLLPFTQVQGLNSSWQWYEKGISIPVLDKKIYPFFGTYFPTRFEHLKLFEKYLEQYKGEKKSAMDIGIGCGVLSFQMLNHGFAKVYGTDTNPNAIIGVYEYLIEHKLSSKIELKHCDLFANCKAKADLIVFNPPWLPASHNTEGLDKAIYYEAEMFPRFFAEAANHLNSEGRVVLLFSNLAQITKSDRRHPIETELAEGKRYQKELFVQEKVGPASEKTLRHQHWRSSEMVELWVLKRSNS